MASSSGEELGEEEAQAELLRHPSDLHPLVPDIVLADTTFLPACSLCCSVLNDGGYSCTICNFHAHKACAKAPLLIPCHPFHPLHPLSLSHNCLSLTCDACGQTLDRCSSYGCSDCGFVVDIRCALFTLPNSDGSSPHGLDGDERQIMIPEHNHPLTPFIANKNFYWIHGCNCALCLEPLSKDVYVCLQPRCKFLIHGKCSSDMYFDDGTRAPRIYHRHNLATSETEEGSIRCGECRSEISSGDYFGCRWCKVFYHRGCLEVPEMVRYPPHPDHTLVLFLCPEQNQVPCQSCSISIMNDLCYSCTGCDFVLHARCVLRTLLYCKEGGAVEIVPSWHDNPLVLCHRPNVYLDRCSCCNKTLDGPAYRCRAKDCKLVLHYECIMTLPEIENHPHHPEHPLLLRAKFGEPHPSCNACCAETFSLSFCCDLCRFFLHVSCASRLPSKKHYLHQHDLVQFEEIPSLECNRCDTITDSPLLRCVPCDFNLHEKCTELPPIVKHKTHHHDLTLRDFFVEDDTGEYYCDLCEERRDERLGIYMCLVCKMDRPWVFDIKCILPELQKVNVKKVRGSIMEKSAEEIAKKEEELFVLEKKVEETKRELEEMRKKHAELSLLKAQGEK